MEKYDICIIGGGLSGLSAAAFLKQKRPEARIALLEKSDLPGGAIKSFQEQGYLAEWGPHGFLDNCEASKALVQFAGLEQEKEMAPLDNFVRYVCLDGKLEEIAQKPLAIIKRPLISVPQKLRVLGDLCRKPLPGEPTVADWVEHRFGAALLPFADAVFTGTYAGDIHRLKIDAVMPGVRALENEHGSVINGLIRRLLAKRKERKEKGAGTRKGLPAMTSFVGGMGRLPLALAAKLEPVITLKYGTAVTAIKRAQEGWQVEAAGECMSAEHLVIALPVNGALKVLRHVENLPVPPRFSIPEARLANVLLGFDDSARIPYGFGYLAPAKEQRFALGALFSSHMFPGRAPAGCQLVEALVGGRRHPDRLELDDQALVNGVYRDLKELIDLPKAPCYYKVLRPASGIPQLEAGHTDLLQWRAALLHKEEGLSLLGFGWGGIGINDMVKEAEKGVERILLSQCADEGPALKGVYF